MTTTETAGWVIILCPLLFVIILIYMGIKNDFELAPVWQKWLMYLLVTALIVIVCYIVITM